MSASVQVSLKGIRKAFDGNPIIRGVDLEVLRGEFLVMLGPSGCGKTTLLRLIAGLEEIDEGELELAGRRANELAPRERDVAMVFQSYALYPHMSVRDNLAFGLALRKTPPEEIGKRVGEAAQLLGLSSLLERRPSELSGGQRQRVAMGRAIVRQPSLFLFDEPLSNLDVALRVQVRGELARLHRRLKATMIYVTHDQVEAMTLATRIALFNQGVLQQLGAPLELYHRPANRFVAGFLGSPPMNFFEAERRSGRLEGKGFSLPEPAGLDAQAGPAVLVGVRPQAMVVDADGPLRGQVDAIERLGFEGYAFVSTEAGPAAARFDHATQFAVGDAVCLSAPQSALHVFSRAGDRAFLHPKESPLGHPRDPEAG